MSKQTIRMKRRMWLASIIGMTLLMPVQTWAADFTTDTIVVNASLAKENAKQDTQQTTIITEKQIEGIQAKSAEDIVFHESGVVRTVDNMGRVGISLRGAEARHTLILVDGQPVMGDFAKYLGAGDELQRISAENVDHIEIIQGPASAKYGADAIGGVVNVITKKPKDKPGFQWNVENRRAIGDRGLPYSNFFLRADSGDMNGVKIAVYGGKRDIMPVYAAAERKPVSDFIRTDRPFEPNELRYSGTIANLGFAADIETGKDKNLSVKWDTYNENLDRYIKRTLSEMEPQQHFKRTVKRDNKAISWEGRISKDTNLKVEANYHRTKEKDITLTSYYGRNTYEGKNELNYIDYVDHKQTSGKIIVTHAVGDKHVLTVSGGTSYESGKGSRLKNAPTTHVANIDPWDFDKSLYVDSKSKQPASTVHNYAFTVNQDGVPKWDYAAEWYGYDKNNPNSVNPEFTYDDYVKYLLNRSIYLINSDEWPKDVRHRYTAFNYKLLKENGGEPDTYDMNHFDTTYSDEPVYGKYDKAYLYYLKPSWGVPILLNGKAFKEAYSDRKNQMTIGEASIRKYFINIQDDWYVNERTTIVPSLRLDHSSLFGNQVTANFGITHHLDALGHSRLKFNVGTGYSEPGLGELYYNWEMYSATPVGMGSARLGWYWIGNPNLKPEKSVNIDVGWEKETKNTYTRLGLFHNTIRDYMTSYFTGYMLDFYPEYNESNVLGQYKYLVAPDMIYSFKNIGKVEITGLQFDWKQKWTDKWSTSLGYTYLHGVNKSDPNLPKKLLNKPVHKLDLGLTYDDNKPYGWRATLWGSYYIKMLDGNSVANNGNYMDSYLNNDLKTSTIRYRFAEGGKQTYEEKTFGIWNFMVQKKFGDNGLAYFGIDNLFNHRDDDRATQQRVYKLGLNWKVGSSSVSIPGIPNDWEPLTMDELLWEPSVVDDLHVANDKWSIIGDMRMQFNSHDGESKPSAKMTMDASIGSAEKNIRDNPNHSMESRIHLGVAGPLTHNTDVAVVGAFSTSPGVDTQIKTEGERGTLHHATLDEARVRTKSNHWTFDVGRLQQKIGLPGYWFNQNFDGARVTYKNDRVAFTVGAGSFKHSTGVEDSPYTTAVHTKFWRPPTVEEFNGVTHEGWSWGNPVPVEGNSENINFYKQMTDLIDNGGTVMDELALVRRMYAIGKKAYGDYLKTADYPDREYKLNLPDVKYTYEDADGNTQESTLESWALGWNDTMRPYISVSYSDDTLISGTDPNNLLLPWWNKYGAGLMKAYQKVANDEVRYIDENAKNVRLAVTADQVYREMEQLNFTVDAENIDSGLFSEHRLPKVIGDYYTAIIRGIEASDDNSKLPREKLGKALGYTVEVIGTELRRDSIPPIERAVYANASYQITPRWIVNGWLFKSVDNHKQTLLTANVDHNDVYNYKGIANVFGIGTSYALGKTSKLTFEYGQNRTSWGRHMNGTTQYDRQDNNFLITGHAMGSNPSFMSLRLDVGQADMDHPGSWQAFIDYKRYEHGSFFGGNGTRAIPDRYLDGIKSYTFGVAYVPVKDFLIEGFYTFGAEGLGKRDTLFGSENFTLGNYTRFQATYRF